MVRLVCQLTRATSSVDCLVADEEIEVLGATLGAQMTTGRASASGEERGLIGDSWATRAGASASSSGAFGRNGSREDKGRGVVSSEAWDNLG